MKAIKYSVGDLEIVVHVKSNPEETAEEEGVDVYEVVEMEEDEPSEAEQRLRNMEALATASSNWILDEEIRRALEAIGL